MNKPYLSIAVVTYNQEEFISEAIDSILLQKHDFSFEIIISDDASTDQTISILNSYKNKYPDIFKLILRDKNVGPSKNIYELLLQCSGKYIALLEGDDFWTDKFKLSKQVNFLENNLKYVACTHRYKVVDENGSIISHEYFGPGRPNNGDYFIADFQNYIYFGLLGSVLFKNIFQGAEGKYDIIISAHPFISDITLNLILVLEGSVFVMADNMAAHRIIIRKNGTNYKSIIRRNNQTVDRIQYLQKLEIFAKNKYNIDLKHVPRNESLFLWALLFLIRYPNLHNYIVFKKVYSLIDNKWLLLKFVLIKIYKIPTFFKKFLKKS
jgi:glycosyltransferase involved in cell wall biosynthesis